MSSSRRSIYQNYIAAGELIDLGMRVSLVSKISGVDIKTLRTFWHESFNGGPPRGKKTNNIGYYIENRKEHRQIASFVLFYNQLTGSKILTTATLVSAYKNFVNTTGISPSLDGIYLLYEYYDEITTATCSKCDALYISVDKCGSLHKCPFCLEEKSR